MYTQYVTETDKISASVTIVSKVKGVTILLKWRFDSTENPSIMIIVDLLFSFCNWRTS